MMELEVATPKVKGWFVKKVVGDTLDQKAPGNQPPGGTRDVGDGWCDVFEWTRKAAGIYRLSGPKICDALVKETNASKYMKYEYPLTRLDYGYRNYYYHRYKTFYD